MSQINIIDAIKKVEPKELSEALLNILLYSAALAKNARGGKDNPTFKKISEFNPIFARMVEIKSGGAKGLVKYGSDEHEALKQRIRKKYEGKSSDELLDLLVDAICSTKQLTIHIKRYQADASELFEIAMKSLVNNLKGLDARKAGKQGNHAKDDERKMECLSITLAALRRDPVPEDYPAFVRTLKLKYPQPLYIPKPRLTREEKLYSQADKNHVIKEKTNLDWKESTLRKFWEMHTGVKPRTKKLSSSK